MPTLRPLPPRPSLEYARKEAKALLRRLRAGDSDVLDRARAVHPQIDSKDPTSSQLADAQLVIAREHGFASWPRLVRYMGDVERQQHAHPQLHWGPDGYEREAQRLLASHRARHAPLSRSLAAFVPRFYGLSLDEVFASTVTEEEARLAVARGHGAPSWEVLVERLEHNARSKPGDWERDAFKPAWAAIAAADVSALERVVAAHPELLQPSDYDISAGRTLIASALSEELKQGAAALQPIMDWLAAHGFDRQRALNLRLCGYGMGRGAMSADGLRALIDQGADPSWVAPSGIPVLEHALLRYWNGELVDVLAAYVRPRKALWIAAGLGDVEGVRGFLDAQGRPTRAARRLRPDFVAVGLGGQQLPDASDEEILVEALVVAILNGRTAVVEYLASRGAPLNSRLFGMPLVMGALNSRTTKMLECLVRCGADLDLPTGDSNGTPREVVRKLFEQTPQDPLRRGFVVACGMDPDALLAARDARPAPMPRLSATVQKALVLAGEDATRLGQAEVRPENLLIGLLRAGSRPVRIMKDFGWTEVERFHTDLADRLAPTGKGADLSELPMHAETQAVIETAISTATVKRQREVEEFFVLHALTGRNEGPVAELLTRYGLSTAKVHADLARWLLL